MKIEDVKKGDPIKASKQNEIIQNLNNVSSYVERQSRMKGGSSRNNESYRFMILDASETSATEAGPVITPKVSLIPGLVDDIDPIIDGVPMTTIPRPSIELTKETVNYITLKVTYEAATTEIETYTFLTNGGSLSTVEIFNYTEVPADVPPTVEDPMGTYYNIIGTVTVDVDGKFLDKQNNGIRTSLNSHFCAPETFYYTMI